MYLGSYMSSYNLKTCQSSGYNVDFFQLSVSAWLKDLTTVGERLELITIICVDPFINTVPSHRVWKPMPLQKKKDFSNYMSILFALEKHPQEILNKNL